MRHFARISLGMLALGLIAPVTASAQYGRSTASGGYDTAPTAVAQPVMPTSNPPAPAPAAQPAESAAPAVYQPAASVAPASTTASAPTAAPALKHIHRWRTVCPACAAMTAGDKPPGKIVGCAHSSNGVCTACKPYLDVPGTYSQAGAPVTSAPGRAVAGSGMGQVGGPEEAMADPAPVGVVQAGYSQSYGGMPAQAPMMGAAPANAPGRAVAESAPGRELYQSRSNNGFPHPHILGHLFGWSGIGSERREEKAFKKAEAHARLTYDPNAPTGVSELPASAVFGKQK